MKSNADEQITQPLSSTISCACLNMSAATARFTVPRPQHGNELMLSTLVMTHFLINKLINAVLFSPFSNENVFTSCPIIYLHIETGFCKGHYSHFVINLGVPANAHTPSLPSPPAQLNSFPFDNYWCEAHLYISRQPSPLPSQGDTEVEHCKFLITLAHRPVCLHKRTRGLVTVLRASAKLIICQISNLRVLDEFVELDDSGW